MESFEPKKLALIRILQILEERTDFEHPLKQEEILSVRTIKYRPRRSNALCSPATTRGSIKLSTDREFQ